MDDDDGDTTGDSALLHGLDALNESILRTVDEQLAKVPEDKQQEVLDAFVAKVPELFGSAADGIVSDLFDSAPKMLAKYRELDESYADEIEKQWGRALDVYRMLWVSCHETGGTFSDRHFNVDGYEPPPMVHAQVGLQARACRVALEVFVLLRSGLGAGALARARTLQEIATTSTLLETHGTPDGDHPDLAERYLLHANVVTWLDAVEFQDVAPKIGYQPFSDDEMAEMQEPRNEGVELYGSEFGKANGWAACLTVNGKAPRFKDLELLAGVDHMRAHYSMASHEVHADAKSWVLNHETIGDITFRNTGPSPRGMVDAAHVALMSLALVTENAVHSAPDVEERPADIIAGMVLNKLLDRAWDEFNAADAQGD